MTNEDCNSGESRGRSRSPLSADPPLFRFIDIGISVTRVGVQMVPQQKILRTRMERKRDAITGDGN